MTFLAFFRDLKIGNGANRLPFQLGLRCVLVFANFFIAADDDDGPVDGMMKGYFAFCQSAFLFYLQQSGRGCWLSLSLSLKQSTGTTFTTCVIGYSFHISF